MFLMKPRKLSTGHTWATRMQASTYQIRMCSFQKFVWQLLLSPKCLIWIFHVFSMQRSCSPACPGLKYEHTWGDDLWIWDLWMCKDFYMYLKYLSKNLTFSFWALYTPQLVCDRDDWGTPTSGSTGTCSFQLLTQRWKLELKILFGILLSLLAKVGGFPWFWSRNVPLPTAFLTDAWVKYT